MKKHTVLKQQTIEERGASVTFSLPVPGKSRKVIGIRISTTILGNPMKVARHYVGVGAALEDVDIDGAVVLALATRQLMNNKVDVFEVEADGSENVFYARRSNIEGRPYFELNGEPVSFSEPVTVSVTDPGTSAVEDYDVYQSLTTGLEGVLYVR